ncbi:hypothetical protein [Saccharopolyspora taberi]|uniref:Uncharacterized protein n=1 Tax=Saccharopolyspora taberi TaxID=60895 RepID=A0ABN3V183_9PSEU
MASRKARNLLSGQQIVRPDKSWDRVHGVRHAIDGAPDGQVLVTTDSTRDEPMDEDALVEIV